MVILRWETFSGSTQRLLDDNKLHLLICLVTWEIATCNLYQWSFTVKVVLSAFSYESRFQTMNIICSLSCGSWSFWCVAVTPHESHGHEFQHWMDREMPQRITCFAQEAELNANRERCVALHFYPYSTDTLNKCTAHVMCWEGGDESLFGAKVWQKAQNTFE